MPADLILRDRRLPLEDADERCVRLVAYWQGRRHAPAAPMRRDIDAADLKPWLGRLHLWERMPDGDFRCRVWGTVIAECTGLMRDGRLLSVVQPRPHAEMAARHYREALALGEPTVYLIRADFDDRHWTYQRAALPLAPGRDTPAMVLNYVLWDVTETRSFWEEVKRAGYGLATPRREGAALPEDRRSVMALPRPLCSRSQAERCGGP